ncbi:hypothetical protein LCGC14_2101270 [marine sediment metagenome]|uniref:Uncharacterized protein n=1 Tax=marine sediment metagenome TaxID=412755 RepID=A0A0F9H6E2_9ZZZZ
MSLATDQAALDEYKAARTKILGSQSYSTAGRSLQRALLKDVEDNIEKYEMKVANYSSGGGVSVRTIEPLY